DRSAVLRLAPTFQLYVLESLFREGYAEDALDLIRSVWGEMLRRGATTCWERLSWDERGEGIEEPAEPPMGSLGHASSGAPTYFWPARILGVMPRVPQEGDAASRSGIPSPAHPVPLRVRPCPAGLEWAQGAIPTLRGPARFGWRQAEEFELTADLPPDVQA